VCCSENYYLHAAKTVFGKQEKSTDGTIGPERYPVISVGIPEQHFWSARHKYGMPTTRSCGLLPGYRSMREPVITERVCCEPQLEHDGEMEFVHEPLLKLRSS
jgi:hypothetical protein